MTPTPLCRSPLCHHRLRPSTTSAARHHPVSLFPELPPISYFLSPNPFPRSPQSRLSPDRPTGFIVAARHGLRPPPGFLPTLSPDPPVPLIARKPPSPSLQSPPPLHRLPRHPLPLFPFAYLRIPRRLQTRDPTASPPPVLPSRRRSEDPQIPILPRLRSPLVSTTSPPLPDVAGSTPSPVSESTAGTSPEQSMAPSTASPLPPPDDATSSSSATSTPRPPPSPDLSTEIPPGARPPAFVRLRASIATAGLPPYTSSPLPLAEACWGYCLLRRDGGWWSNVSDSSTPGCSLPHDLSSHTDLRAKSLLHGYQSLKQWPSCTVL